MKSAYKKIDIALLIMTILLCVFGLVMIFSSSNVAAVLEYKEPGYYFFKKQLMVMIFGIIVSLIVLKIPTKSYVYLSPFILIGVFILLIGLRTYGTVTNSARSWIPIFGVSIQPSEFAKTSVILYLACIYGEKKKFGSIWEFLMPLLICAGVFLLVVMEPDLGTAGIIALICAFIFFSLPVDRNSIFKYMKIFAVGVLIVGVLVLNMNKSLLTNTQMKRFQFKNPCDRYLEDTGYQVCNGYIAINNGGLHGVGLGKSTQKYMYLPESYTDFVFPIIVEELGLVGGGAIIVAYMILLYRILVIARNASSLRGSIIAFGTFAFIFIHIFVNMGGLLALIPLTGVPLPFLSYGGSFLLNLMILLALTQRVAIETNIARYKKSVKKVIGG